MHLVGILASFLLIASASTTTPTALARCEDGIASFADHDRAFEKVLEEEPVWYLGAIKNAIEFRREESVVEVAELREELTRRAGQFRALEPSSDLAAQHSLMADYLDSVIAAVAAVEQRDLPYDRLSTKELILRLPTRRCYELLLAYYRELLELFERHECDMGDAEAVRERFIPHPEEVLVTQFTENRGL